MVNAKTSTKDATWHTYIRCVVCRRRTKTSNPISSRHFYHSTIEEFISPPLVVKTYKARQLTSSARADATHETSTLTERCQWERRQATPQKNSTLPRLAWLFDGWSCRRLDWMRRTLKGWNGDGRRTRGDEWFVYKRLPIICVCFIVYIGIRSPLGRLNI